MADDNKNFTWVGMDKLGKRTSGEISAVDMRTAEAELKRNGIEIIKLKPKSSYNIVLFEQKIKERDIVIFTKYLSTMIKAGMPIIQSLEIISNDQENPALKKVISSVKNDVASGMALSDALAKYPDQFDSLYCSLVLAGEKSGTIDQVLTRLAAYLDHIRILKGKIKSAMIYPATIVFIAIFVSAILLFFVVPQFQTMFEKSGVPLPGFTQAVITFSNFLRNYWLPVLIVIVVLLFTYKRLKKTNEKFHRTIDKLKLKIPIVGPVLQKAIIARFTSTLAITLDAGLPIVDAIKSMVGVMGNRIYSEGIEQLADDVIAGHQLSVSLAATGLFPNMVVQMVGVGEASGRLPEMLNNIADYYQEEVNYIADNLGTILEPIIIVILGVIIGVFVLAMYMPIFKIGTTVG